jgi:hypothetical protein
MLLVTVNEAVLINKVDFDQPNLDLVKQRALIYFVNYSVSLSTVSKATTQDALMIGLYSVDFFNCSNYRPCYFVAICCSLKRLYDQL